MGFLEPVLWIRDNEGLKAEREREGGRKPVRRPLRTKEQGVIGKAVDFMGILFFNAHHYGVSLCVCLDLFSHLIQIL